MAPRNYPKAYQRTKRISNSMHLNKGNTPMTKLKVAVIVGSNRKESINRKLAEGLVDLIPDSIETSFVQIDDLPMYNMDLEANRPDVVNRFTREVAATDAVLFVTPEFN